MNLMLCQMMAVCRFAKYNAFYIAMQFVLDWLRSLQKLVMAFVW